MSEKKIITTKPNTLSPKDKEKLAKAGFIVIEHPEPHTGMCFISEKTEYVYQNCIKCGDRIYMTKERLNALRSSANTTKPSFYCPQGHPQSFI